MVNKIQELNLLLNVIFKYVFQILRNLLIVFECLFIPIACMVLHGLIEKQLHLVNSLFANVMYSQHVSFSLQSDNLCCLVQVPTVPKLTYLSKACSKYSVVT